MTLKLQLVNGTRLQRKRKGDIILRNTEKQDGRRVAQFFDAYEFYNACIPVPFAECPVGTIKTVSGVIPVVATYAK